MPKMPPRPCTNPRCRAYAVKGGKCETHQKIPWDHGNKSRHERGYDYKWVVLRKRILKRDGHLCQDCKRNGRISLAQMVDHIINKASGGTDDDDNLEAICRRCHSEKTQLEAARGRGGGLKVE